MKFRVVQIGNEFFSQKRTLFGWKSIDYGREDTYNSMRNQQSFRCFSKKDEDQWVSICIDLNLAAQADTQKESRRKLESMIRTYVYEAYTCHSKYKEQLLNRKAPWSIRLEYHKIALLKN